MISGEATRRTAGMGQRAGWQGFTGRIVSQQSAPNLPNLPEGAPIEVLSSASSARANPDGSGMPRIPNAHAPGGVRFTANPTSTPAGVACADGVGGGAPGLVGLSSTR